MPDAVLAADHVSKVFGGLTAIGDLTFTLHRGDVMGLIGPNGAGKTTLFNLLSGFLRPTRGTVTFKGKPLDGLRPHDVVRLGLTRTFQIPRPFHGLTCRENVTVAMLAGTRPGAEERKRVSAKVEQILARVGLEGKAAVLPDTLTQGHLKQLEIARALATAPEVLLLDEPFAGLTSEEISRLTAVIGTLHGQGLTLVIVEHKLRELMRIVERVLVLNFGMKIADGRPEEIARDPRVLEAYLGATSEALAPA